MDDHDPWFHDPLENIRSLGRSLRRRVLGSLAVVTGGMVALVLYLGFLAVHFPWYENAAVVLTIFLLTPALVIGMWASWALHACDRWSWSSADDA